MSFQTSGPFGSATVGAGIPSSVSFDAFRGSQLNPNPEISVQGQIQAGSRIKNSINCFYLVHSVPGSGILLFPPGDWFGYLNIFMEDSGRTDFFPSCLSFGANSFGILKGFSGKRCGNC